MTPKTADLWYRKRIGKNIRYLRKLAGLTQRQLAEQMGWGVAKGKILTGMVSQIENGRGVGTETLGRIAEKLGVPMHLMFAENLDEVYPTQEQKLQESLKNCDEKTRSNILSFQTLFKGKPYELAGLIDHLAPAAGGSRRFDKLHLPGWTEGKKPENHFCVIVDDETLSPEFKKGNIVCVDPDDIPGPEDEDFQNRSLLVLYKEKTCIFKTTKKGHMLYFDIPGFPPENPAFYDLRIGANILIGKILWVYKEYV